MKCTSDFGNMTLIDLLDQGATNLLHARCFIPNYHINYYYLHFTDKKAQG